MACKKVSCSELLWGIYYLIPGLILRKLLSGQCYLTDSLYGLKLFNILKPKFQNPFSTSVHQRERQSEELSISETCILESHISFFLPFLFIIVYLCYGLIDFFLPGIMKWFMKLSQLWKTQMDLILVQLLILLRCGNFLSSLPQNYIVKPLPNLRSNSRRHLMS